MIDVNRLLRGLLLRQAVLTGTPRRRQRAFPVLAIAVRRLPAVGNGSGTSRVAEGLPGKPDIHVVPAGHFAFLALCSPQLAAAVPRICTDVPAGFDRATFHREFNATLVKFFREQFGER
ncbi:hypothetical protein AAE026_37105 [Bradyrhizobium sp. DN5]|uniref:hypothetical protein n=1 Tax=Bradyrhizobium sp. DN5 TaxID=3056950 RepID=UPI0035267286